MACDEEVATNLYHTSSSAVPEQPGKLCVAPAEDPEIWVHTVDDSKAVAVEQSSDWAIEIEVEINKLTKNKNRIILNI